MSGQSRRPLVASVLYVLVSVACFAFFGVPGCSDSSDGPPGGIAEPIHKQSVAAVFPVTVDAFVQFQNEARAVLKAKQVDFHCFSAEGHASRFPTIINAALLKKPAVLILVGTQLSNTGLAPRYEQQLPKVVCSCISDPTKVDQLATIGLAPPRKRPVAVVRDMPRQDAYVYGAQIIRKVTPAITKVGILFNNAEINSKNTASKMADALRNQGIKILDGVISSEADVGKVAKNLILRGAQMLVIPHDKNVIKQAATVVKIGMEAPTPVPVFSLDDGTVRKDGAAYGVSVNYGELGRLTGELCLRILEGEDPSQLPVIQKETANAYFNMDSWKRLGLPDVPEGVAKGSILYGGQGN